MLASRLSVGSAGEIRILPLTVAGEIHARESLSESLLAAAKASGLQFQDGDVLVVKHKVVSKSEGALVALDEVHPSAASRAWARRYGLDARVTELALRESRRVVRRKRGVLITETRHGFICANSGVDVSNVDGGTHAALLPKDPDRSAAGLRRTAGPGSNNWPVYSFSGTVRSRGRGGMSFMHHLHWRAIRLSRWQWGHSHTSI